MQVKSEILKLSSWNRYPIIDSKVIFLESKQVLSQIVNDVRDIIAYGNGRSYGDAPLNEVVLYSRPYNYFIDFDERNGVLHVQSGVLLSEIIDVFLPRGWFPKITPGTKFITVGGAIAADVHGKNHHIDGCFSECVLEFNLMLPDGSIKLVKRGDELFKATCGGMGLTGIILDAKISLIRVNSKNINQIIIKTKNLKETFEAFEKYSHYRYSVAWIDCLSSNNKIGRGLLMVGDFANDGDLNYKPKLKLNVPFDFPSFTLNSYSVRLFNEIYYNRIRKGEIHSKIDFEKFFYPLDSIYNWNRIYGRNGFLQYQFILPKENSYDGISEILREISKSGKGSFLAVLKLYGKENENYLSFPLEGYSLALDFKIERGIFELLDKLDKVVIKYGGRIYLAKDARVKREVFERGYPNLDRFRKIRKEYEMENKFNSLLSRRLEI